MAIEDGKRLRDFGLQTERTLWPDKGPGVFEQEVEAIERAVGLTTLEKAVAWAQSKSMWPDTFGLACCAIEMMSIVSSRYDIARFGMEAFRSSPRQADLLIVSGRVVHKMAAPLRQVYDQMLEPKWVIAMGACASSGGMFNNYTTLQGVDTPRLVDAALHLRDELGFNFLSDVAATDYLGWGAKGVSGYIGTDGGRNLNEPATQGYQRLPGEKPRRFSVSYHLLGMRTGAPRVP